jgi:hypothetical protein
MTKDQAEQLAGLLAEHNQVTAAEPSKAYPARPKDPMYDPDDWDVRVHDMGKGWLLLPSLYAVTTYTVGLKLPPESLMRALLEYLLDHQEEAA